MKALILGASGLLGKALMREWGEDSVVGLSLRDIDIRGLDRVRGMNRSVRTWIVLAAAFTNVDACESEPVSRFCRESRWRGPCRRKAAKRSRAKLLFLSSDYMCLTARRCLRTEAILAPWESAKRLRTIKAEAEIQLLKVLPECCIARTRAFRGLGGNALLTRF